MFKPVTSVFLILVLTAQAFKGGVIALGYYTNMAAFAKNCINKARPQMHCNGKCQMMKKILEEEKKDQQMPERKAENENEVIISSKTFFVAVVLPTPEFVSSLKIVDRPYSKSTGIHFKIFHPPRFS